MRRLFLTIAAALAVVAPLASPDAAWAKDGRGRGDGGWQQQQQEQRGGGDRGGRGGDHGDRGGDRRGGNWRGDEGRGNGNGRWREAPPRDYPMPQQAPSPRRGGYLPPYSNGGVVQDNARYRLRAPPRGYTWVRIGGSFALVSEATGQVFDVVPGR
jgi:Ni/Co efflux regulator RcnB